MPNKTSSLKQLSCSASFLCHFDAVTDSGIQIKWGARVHPGSKIKRGPSRPYTFSRPLPAPVCSKTRWRHGPLRVNGGGGGRVSEFVCLLAFLFVCLVVRWLGVHNQFKLRVSQAFDELIKSLLLLLLLLSSSSSLLLLLLSLLLLFISNYLRTWSDWRGQTGISQTLEKLDMEREVHHLRTLRRYRSTQRQTIEKKFKNRNSK